MRLLFAVQADPQETTAVFIDLIDERQVFVTSLVLNLIDFNGFHAGFIAKHLRCFFP